ncbi:TatD family deoxyribonuclease [Verrucomicrobia bacterium LW23]|nr:TatD family deoxyribonuclease [Verrucomicrobia bacterium LW23]
MIDTHAHLDFPDFDADREGVLTRAAQAGVREIISIGTRLDTSANAVELATRYAAPAASASASAADPASPETPIVWATVGIHPGEADTIIPDGGGPAVEGWIDELRRMAANPRVVAIGEIGFDYHHLPSEKLSSGIVAAEAPADGHSAAFSNPQAEAEAVDRPYKARQEEIFRRQLDLAVELGLNVVIHQRDSWYDTLEVLRDYRGRVRGVFHCFGGTEEQARTLLDDGHLISFTGIVTFKNARQVYATAQAVPLDSFMLETDCPYLAPAPHRGKRCEPAHTARTAEFIALARGMELEELVAATNATARGFFAFNRS